MSKGAQKVDLGQKRNSASSHHTQHSRHQFILRPIHVLFPIYTSEMPRSATQRATRRRRRQLQPKFPLFQLPPELQLHVLCKCDFTSLRRLLRLSPYLRGLFLAYPEACLQEILQRIPRPAQNLLRASWALHNVNNNDFDPDKTLAFLDQTKITEDWSILYPYILRSKDDPMEALERLIDLHEEISTVVELYAKSVNAIVETFVNPYVLTTPITLSTAECNRIACGFWLLKIFYQFQLKFARYNQANDFIRTFMEQLSPWQVEQGLSIECFLQSSCWYGHYDPYILVDERMPTREDLSEQYLYVRNYFKVTNELPRPSLTPGIMQPTFFSRATRYYSYGFHEGWDQLPRLSAYSDAECSSVTNQLRSHGWTYFESAVRAHTIPGNTYRQFFLGLGMFFWDKDRLEAWELANPRHFTTVVKALSQRLTEAKLYWERKMHEHCTCRIHTRLSFTKRIIQWTRSSVQCSFEEWEYQRQCFSGPSPIHEARP